MNPIQDSEKLVDGRKESNIRRPVPKYQHYIDHFEELCRQSPLAKVMGQNASSSIPSKRYADSISSNTSGSFKVPLVSPMLKPKPVPASVGAFIMSPVARLIQQMQSTGGVTKKDSEKEHASTSRVEMSPPESLQNEDWHDSERNDEVQREQRLVTGGKLSGFQPEHGQEVESLEVADAAVSSAEAEEEEDASLYSDVPSVKDVMDRMDGEKERMEEEEETEIKGSDPDSCDKPTLEASSLGSVSKAREKRKSLRRKAMKSNSDLEQSNIGSCDDVAKQAGKTVTDLDQWIIKWLGSGLKHIAVEGHRLEDPEGSFWHSTAIIKRNSSCLVETSSGSRYRLHGNINKLLARDQGFSKKFLRRFQKGFPAKWRAYLVEEAMEQSDKKVEVTVPGSTDTGTTKTSNTPVINCGRLTTHKIHSTLKKEKLPAVTKTPSNDSETTPVSRKREAVVVTPSFVSVEEVRTTRSGRKVLPPLQYWRGQRQRTLLYMGGAAELLEGSVDHTPVSATRLGVKGSIGISQRAKRLGTRKKNPRSRRQAEKSKHTTSQRDGSFKESESEDDQLDRIQKRAVNARTERNLDTSNTMKADGEECSLDALPEQGSLRLSSRKSLDTSNHQKSADRPRSVSQTGVCGASNISSPGSGVEGDATDKSSQPYDLYSAVMGVVKENRQRRISNQSRRRRSREANMSSTSAPEQGEENFNISDDEDFKNEVSASATEGDEKNSSLSRKGFPVPSTSNKSISKHKWKVSSKANERVLLGSNMVPPVVLEKYDHNDLNAGVKSKGSSGSGKQDKAEHATSKKTKKAPPKSRRSKRIQETNEKWKPDELHRFHRALKIIPPSSKQFWHRVASSVGTRTEWECQQEHQAKLEGATKESNQSKGTTKDSKESNQGAKEPVALTAAKGTMKRKRQLRELIQQHNQASEEDLFDSTPFKKQRKTTMPLLNLDLGEEEEDDDEGMRAKTPGSARLKTPSTRFHNLLAPLSGKKTPHSSAMISPGLLNSVEKKHMDKYIFGMQKKRVGRRVKKVPETTHNVSPPLKVRQRQLKTQTMAMTPTISEAFQVDPVQGTDSDEDEADYYWSDEENHSVPNSKKY